MYFIFCRCQPAGSKFLRHASPRDGGEEPGVAENEGKHGGGQDRSEVRDLFALAVLTSCQGVLRHFDHAVTTASCVAKGPRDCGENGMLRRLYHSHPMRPGRVGTRRPLAKRLTKSRSAITHSKSLCKVLGTTLTFQMRMMVEEAETSGADDLCCVHDYACFLCRGVARDRPLTAYLSMRKSRPLTQPS